jgi:hypothetical protein
LETALNKEGTEIKKIKRRDFKESSVSERSGNTDNKLLYLDYASRELSIYAGFEVRLELLSTAFIPSWYPVESAS